MSNVEDAVMNAGNPVIRWQRVVGLIGACAAFPFLAWLPLGLLESVPSMVDVFGVPGLRIPASVAVAGLLMAAVGFHES